MLGEQRILSKSRKALGVLEREKGIVEWVYGSDLTWWPSGEKRG